LTLPAGYHYSKYNLQIVKNIFILCDVRGLSSAAQCPLHDRKSGFFRLSNDAKQRQLTFAYLTQILSDII